MPCADASHRLTLLSEAEKQALYELPDFDDFQRAEYFSLTPEELTLVHQRKGLVEQVYCLLQIGYFKAKQAFFQFSLQEVPPEDIAFVLQRYFPRHVLKLRTVRNNECYAQRYAITQLFGYRPWKASDRLPLTEKITQLARRDCLPAFLLAELIIFLNNEKIVRPGYSTLQVMIRDALSIESRRLESLMNAALDEKSCKALDQLIERKDTLSELAAIKQDAKHFGYQMMVKERNKRTTLEPLYLVAKKLLPTLLLSKQNLHYYASLAHYYTVYDLRRLKSEKTYLYLLCYVWQRYQQLSDNLVDALGYHLKKLEDMTKEKAAKAFTQSQTDRQQNTTHVGRLLLLYVDDHLQDSTAFGVVRQQAFDILPKESLLATGQRLCEKMESQHELRWQSIDKMALQFKKQLRPLFMTLDFSSMETESPWLRALTWMKDIFSRKQTLTTRTLATFPKDTIPKRLHPYLMKFDSDGNAMGIHGDRYEFWIYRQIRKRFSAGDLYLNDSLRHRALSDELVNMEEKSQSIQALSLPWLNQPIDVTLNALFNELDGLWRDFDRDLRRGKLKHLDYDPAKKVLKWRKPKVDKNEALETAFYESLPASTIADIFRFVNERCHFLSALTPLQPRYAKKIADEDSLMAAIIAQAMNHGNYRMAEASDIPYAVLDTMHQQYLRLSTLKAANDSVSNFIAQLPIFSYYSFDLDVLYGSVDGQKLGAATPTIKARHSRKYFHGGRGVVAYTLLVNHVSLQTEMIGANEHESYFVFDICYNNTSDIIPTAITGDMHSINKANFAIMHWFGLPLCPRFTNLQAQLSHLYCSGDPARYEKFLIRPVDQIDRELIISEKANMDQIAATLGLKEMKQSTLIRKLCTYSQHNRTRRAIFEFDKLIRSIYTLRYLRDPQLQRNVHRSQNRIEAYHQLRSVITQVGGKKELTGRTDLDMAISNECGRLIANIITAYNSVILSKLLERYEAADNKKALASLKKISPIAWQHIHFLGKYIFRDSKHSIDLEAILEAIHLD